MKFIHIVTIWLASCDATFPNKECTCVDKYCRYFQCNSNDSNKNILMCRSKDDVSSSKFPMTVMDATEDIMKNLICVVKDNNSVRSDYFEYIESSHKLFDSHGVKKYSYQMGGPTNNDNNKHSSGNAIFEKGDPIALIDENGDFVDGGEWRMPLPSGTGFCQDFAKVQYGESISKPCVRYMSDLDLNQCESGSFSIAYYHNNFSVGTRKSASLASKEERVRTGNNPLFIPININRVLLDNGTDIAINLVNTSWNETTGACTNAVRSISYNVALSESNGSIEDVAIDIYLMDMEYLTGVIKVQQTFSINFETNSNQNESPGYNFGDPVLFAKPSLTDNSLLLRSKLKFIEAGHCTHSQILEVAFGEDFVTGCSLKLNKTELEDICTSTLSTHPYLSSSLSGESSIVHPKWFELDFNDLHVGIFRYSDISDPNEWVQVKANNSMKRRQWLSTESKCEGLLTGIKFELMWTYSGHISSPQAKILASRVSYEFRPLKHFTRDTKQHFEFSFGVSWTYIDTSEKLISITPRTPSLLFSLPSDAFYPFE